MEELIPVTWINKYHWCPRMVYFEAVMGYRERVTELMEQGKEEHGEEDRREKRRKTLDRRERVLRKWRRLEVASERLRMKGVVDLVVETDKGLCVVETKNAIAGRTYRRGHLYQAVAYAMLAEEVIKKPVKYVELRYLKDGKVFKMRVTEEMRRHVLWTVRKIEEMIEREEMPSRGIERLCRVCGYWRICRGI